MEHKNTYREAWRGLDKGDFFSYIIHTMNYSYNELSSPSSAKDQAKMLASLTQSPRAVAVRVRKSRSSAGLGLPVAAGRVLLAVAETETSSPSAVAKKLGLGRSRLTPLVEILVRKKLLLRAESENDRRVRDLELTETGRKVAHEVNDFHLSFHEDLLQHYHESERQKLLTVLLQNLQTTMEEVRMSMKENPKIRNPKSDKLKKWYWLTSTAE